MTILAIDTTGKTAGAALVREGCICAELNINNNFTHSQTLMPMIDNILSISGINKHEITHIACSAGPGSFTGLRIGAAAAKGLAFALGTKIVPVSTLDALAYNISHENIAIIPIMDARREQVYTAVYTCEDGRIARTTDYLACPMEEVLKMAEGKKTIFLGDGTLIHHDKIAKYTEFSIAPSHNALQRAASVGIIALENIDNAVYPRDFVPFYIRPSQAEREKGKVNA